MHVRSVRKTFRFENIQYTPFPVSKTDGSDSGFRKFEPRACSKTISKTVRSPFYLFPVDTVQVTHYCATRTRTCNSFRWSEWKLVTFTCDWNNSSCNIMTIIIFEHVTFTNTCGERGSRWRLRLAYSVAGVGDACCCCRNLRWIFH